MILAEIVFNAETVRACGDLVERLWSIFGLWFMAVVFALIAGWVLRGRRK